MKPSFKIHDKKTIVFLVCLVISIFLWFLIKLSKEYELNIEIPVKLQNLPRDQILISKSDSTINVRVKDNGFDLIGTDLFGISTPIIIDVRKLHKRSLRHGKTKAYILTSSFDDLLQQQFNSASSISHIKPDSIVLIFENEAHKKVKIHAALTYTLASQFQLYQPLQLWPDSVVLFGSTKELSKVDSISTEKLKLSDLDTDINKSIPLIIPENLKCENVVTQLMIDVEKFTEASVQIPIQHRFTKDGQVKIFPKHIQIKYAVSLKDYHLIKPEQFQIMGTEDSLSVGKLNITLKEFPDNVKIIDYTPKVAEFIYIK